MKNYLVLKDDKIQFECDAYSEAVNRVSRLYKQLRVLGYVVTPIINGQFTYYEDGKDGDDGVNVKIVSCNE